MGFPFKGPNRFRPALKGFARGLVPRQLIGWQNGRGDRWGRRDNDRRRGLREGVQRTHSGRCGADGVPVFSLGGSPSVQVPYLRFGAKAPISEHIEPHLTQHALHEVSHHAAEIGVLRDLWRGGVR